MLRGLYTAATGMAVQRSKMDVLTNNIVNAETTGFKKDNLVSSSFGEVLMERLNDSNVVHTAKEVGPFSFGTHIDEIYTNFSEGNLEETGRKTDLAISGGGYFVVQTPDGERYTRAGNFSVNSLGYLQNSDGWYVLGENGPIDVGGDDFSVDAEGNVMSDGIARGTLRVAAFPQEDDLRKQGDNLYYSNRGQIPGAAENYTIVQGYQESSNVDITVEIVDMMRVYRTYEASQKILTMTDETLGLAVNELGRLG